MTMNGEHLDKDFLYGRTVALQSQVDELRRDTAGIPRLAAEIRHLANQVRALGQAVGLRAQVTLPDDWEDITQVRRPELHQLKKSAEENERRAAEQERRARTRPLWASIVTTIAWVIVEVVRAIADGRISFH